MVVTGMRKRGQHVCKCVCERHGWRRMRSPCGGEQARPGAWNAGRRSDNGATCTHASGFAHSDTHGPARSCGRGVSKPPAVWPKPPAALGRPLPFTIAR